MKISRGITKEEKIAGVISKLMSDLYIDLDMVGYYLYRAMPPLMYNRFQETAHAAEHEKQMNENETYRRTMNNLGI